MNKTINNEYLLYLKTDEWRNKRDKRLKIDNYTCQLCKCKHTPDNPLEVHHFTYHNIYKENVYVDLVTLCHRCHYSVHEMMNRITNEHGRHGWKDIICVPSENTNTLNKEILEKKSHALKHGR